MKTNFEPIPVPGEDRVSPGIVFGDIVLFVVGILCTMGIVYFVFVGETLCLALRCWAWTAGPVGVGRVLLYVLLTYFVLPTSTRGD